MSNFTIPKGHLNFTTDYPFTKENPKLLMIGMVDNDAFNGKFDKNPFNFQHFTISRLALYANGVSVPSQPLCPNFKGQSYVECYFRLMDAYHYYNTDDTNGLKYSE